MVAAVWLVLATSSRMRSSPSLISRFLSSGDWKPSCGTVAAAANAPPSSSDRAATASPSVSSRERSLVADDGQRLALRGVGASNVAAGAMRCTLHARPDDERDARTSGRTHGKYAVFPIKKFVGTTQRYLKNRLSLYFLGTSVGAYVINLDESRSRFACRQTSGLRLQQHGSTSCIAGDWLGVATLTAGLAASWPPSSGSCGRVNPWVPHHRLSGPVCCWGRGGGALASCCGRGVLPAWAPSAGSPGRQRGPLPLRVGTRLPRRGGTRRAPTPSCPDAGGPGQRARHAGWPQRAWWA